MMPNKICRNHTLYKDFLSAHRQAYSRAKSGRKLEIQISFAPVILCQILHTTGKLTGMQALTASSSSDPDAMLAVFALLGTLALLYCDLVLDPIRKMHRRSANLDLEAYDTSVMDLPWSESVAGKAKDQAEAAGDAQDYQQKLAQMHPPELSLTDSWYPIEIESAPLERARIYCLRQNCAFELAYRHKYLQWFLMPMLIFTTILVLIQSWVFGSTATSICLTLIMVAPVYRIILLGLKVQSKKITEMTGLKADIDAARAKLTEDLTGDLTLLARSFQDRLFISRDTLPLISISGFKYIKANYLPALKAETAALLRQDGLID